MKRYFFILMLLFCIPIDTAKSSTDTVAKKIELAEKVRTSDHALFLELIAELEQLELTEAQKAKLEYFVAYKHSFSGDYATGAKILERLIEKDIDIELKHRSISTLVNLHTINSDYLKSLYFLDELQKISNLTDNSELKNSSNVVAALTYNNLGQYSFASDYALSAVNSTSDQRTKCIASQLRVEALYGMKQLQQNLDFLEGSKKLCRDEGEDLYYLILLTLEIRALHDKEQYREALVILQENEQAILSTKYPRIISEYYYLFAHNQFLQSKNDLAMPLAMKALDTSNTSDNNVPLMLTNKLLADIYEENGDYDKALNHFKAHVELNNDYIDDLAAKELAYLDFIYKANEKTRQIELLNKQNEVLTLEQDLAKKDATNNRLMIALLISILAFIAFWIYRIKRSQAKLRQQAETDQLTGVGSRHHFYDLSKRTLMHSESSQLEVSFILFDMDKFKSINDNYGHLVGDWVLKEALRVSKVCWRKNDIAGRLGGEEFAIMLPSCSLEKAIQIAEHCRAEIEKVDTTNSGFSFPISASFGVTSTTLSGYDLKSLIADADKALYDAKEAGRNKVNIAH